MSAYSKSKDRTGAGSVAKKCQVNKFIDMIIIWDVTINQ
jgi:hypothetical protein